MVRHSMRVGVGSGVAMGAAMCAATFCTRRHAMLSTPKLVTRGFISDNLKE
uniref:Uncharacterized protein n=1 Tax=Hyaloperonospora arabidopsidis (strain Emoy2) TaxID=559515 RepID=M4BHX6_HYAAE